MPSYETIATAALSLDPADRLRPANELIESLDGVTDPDWEAAWLAEIQARLARGSEGALPWEEVRARIVARRMERVHKRLPRWPTCRATWTGR